MKSLTWLQLQSTGKACLHAPSIFWDAQSFLKTGMNLAIHICRHEEATDKRCLKLVLTDGVSAGTRNQSALATSWCPYK